MDTVIFLNQIDKLLEDHGELFKLTLYSFLSANQRADLLKAVQENINKRKEFDLQRIISMIVAGAYLHRISNQTTIDEDEFRSILFQSSYISNLDEAVELRRKTIENYLSQIKYLHPDFSEEKCRGEMKKEILQYIEKMENSMIGEEIELPKIMVEWKEVFTRAKEI